MRDLYFGGDCRGVAVLLVSFKCLRVNLLRYFDPGIRFFPISPFPFLNGQSQPPPAQPARFFFFSPENKTPHK